MTMPKHEFCSSDEERRCAQKISLISLSISVHLGTLLTAIGNRLKHEDAQQQLPDSSWTSQGPRYGSGDGGGDDGGIQGALRAQQ